MSDNTARAPGGNPVDFVAVSGEIDISTAPKLHEKLMDAMTHDPSELIIDLTDVTFIDSTGLGVLVNARQRAKSVGTEMKLMLPTGQARYPFEMTGLVSIFDLAEPQPS